MKDKIYFVGFMGAGKTTIGRLYAQETRWNFIDTDALIEEKAGCSISEIFEKQGESAFRGLETEVLQDIGRNSDTVVSCGGGIILNGINVEIMRKDGHVLYLRAQADTLAERLADANDRPLLQRGEGTLKERIADILSQRSGLYENAADIIIDTDGKTPEDIVAEIKKQFLQKA